MTDASLPNPGKNADRVVLIVEDELPLLQAIKKKLEKNGFTAITARTVEQALQYVEEIGKIDAVWLDHYLIGQENGLDFVAKLKEKAGTKHIPIFVVSNTASPDKVRSYMGLGINKYFVKAENRLDVIIDQIEKFFDDPED